MKYYGYITYVQKIIFLNVQNKCWILFFSPQIQNIMCNVPFQYKNVKSTNYKGKIYNCVTYQSLVKLFRNKGRKLWRSQDTSFMIAPPEILWILVPISPLLSIERWGKFLRIISLTILLSLPIFLHFSKGTGMDIFFLNLFLL